MSEKGQKAGFLALDKLQNRSSEGKKKREKEKARKKKGGEEQKAMVALLVFIMVTLAEKKRLTEATYLVITFSKIRQDINWDKSVLPLG